MNCDNFGSLLPTPYSLLPTKEPVEQSPVLRVLKVLAQPQE
ncbi:hypothetical protein BJP36_36425 [Moorena producens JHB]|uniref:Uncharacterized protein n=1 Tax=Moorena producens (strain JHB) TaxID=1454205 RepID=A0A9Q9STV9_MOOP1|nr:hypothetical protein [Moorena producens]WAN69577.1 hypothetical protein BJP36_36425 [Moorena producens JHB]